MSMVEYGTNDEMYERVARNVLSNVQEWHLVMYSVIVCFWESTLYVEGRVSILCQIINKSSKSGGRHFQK